jgi:hypothetical protein
VKDKQVAGDHAANHCRGQCLEICGNLGGSGSECVAQEMKGFCEEKWNVA